MKQVYLEIVNQDSCNSSIRGADRKVPYILTNDMFCAGGGLGHDACSVSSFQTNLHLKNRNFDVHISIMFYILIVAIRT